MGDFSTLTLLSPGRIEGRRRGLLLFSVFLLSLWEVVSIVVETQGLE